MSASPAAGPSRIATAAARFSSTTGDGSARSSTSYSPTICGQSVVALGAPRHARRRSPPEACKGRTAGRQRPLHERDAFLDLRAIPERAILVFEQNHLAGRRRPGGAPRFVQQHQRQQAHRLGLRQQLHQQPSEPNRLARQVSAA